MTSEHDGSSIATKTLMFPDTVGRSTDRWLIVLQPRDGEYRVIQQRPAKGIVTLPASARVQLIFFPGRPADLSTLAALTPDALDLLEAARTTFDNRAMSHVGALTGLRHLHLGNTPLSNEGLAHLHLLTALEGLDLRGTAIDDDGLIALQHLRQLRHLNLSMTRITDAGLRHLEVLHGLRSLVLYATGVSDAGLEHLNELHALEVLRLEETHVTMEGAGRLPYMLPGCQVHLDWNDGVDEAEFPYGERARRAREADLSLHAALPTRGKPGSPGWEAYQQLLNQWREAVAEAYPSGFWERLNLLQHGDLRGLETAVRFLEADPWLFRSGYVKERILRRLRRISLSEEYRSRLRHVILQVIQGQDRREFREYCRLARIVDTPAWRETVLALLDHENLVVRRHAMWVLDALRRPPSIEPLQPEDVDPADLDFKTLDAYLYYYGGTPASFRAAVQKAAAAGVGGEAMRDLAIAPDFPGRDWRLQYYQALRDTDWSVCVDTGRWMIVARDIAQRLVDGRIADPYRGARLLYDRFVQARSPEAVTWFRLLYDLEQQPADPGRCAAILAQATRLLHS
jgi:Leucine Rich repeat